MMSTKVDKITLLRLKFKSILLLTFCSILMIKLNCKATLLETNENSNKDQNQQDGPHRVTVVAQKLLRPNSDYNVLINLAYSQLPALIDLQLSGARDSNREQTQSKSLLIQSGETQTVKFSIGDWPDAEYVLNVQAQANDRSWNFTQEAQLEYKPKSFSAFIQTDKAIYKPGQLVQFRAIFLTKTLTPHNLKNEINVTVSDPQKNLIKQWLQLSTYRGLLSLELPLSQDPMFGDYTIKVEAAKNQATTKKFTVAEYILPTFDVDIQLPTYATYNESDVVATVKATYNYGKPVDGHVTMTVQPLSRFYSLETRPLQQSQYRARLKDGSADISLNIVKDLLDKLKQQQQENSFAYRYPSLDHSEFGREIEFFALVEEDLTGRTYNKTKVMKLYEKEIKVELINSDNRSFKPGLKHQLRLKVAYQDDTPVEDNGPELELRYGSAGQLMEVVKLQPVRGIAEHTIDVPKKVTPAFYTWSDLDPVTPDTLDLQATYRGQKYRLGPISRFNSNSGQYMQISLPQLEAQLPKQQSSRLRLSSAAGSASSVVGEPAANVGDQLKVQVLATEGMQQVTCLGLANGDIIWAVSRDAKNETQFEFEIEVDQRMAPEAKILCFYIRPAAENKEMISDAISFKVNGLIRNVAKITTSRDEAKPGQEVEIGVLTKPNSLVGLLAIDQSVLLLKSGNDITQKDLINDLQSYASNNINERGTSDALGLFTAANLIVLTNDINFNPPILTWNYFSEARPGNSRIKLLKASPLLVNQISSLTSENKPQQKEQIIIRSNFPETWLWENGTANSQGIYNVKSKIPDTITSWVLSAFSLNENFGLGLTNSKSSIRVFRPFFIKLNLPYSIIRGEVVTIQAIIFNYSKRPTTARLVVDNSKQEFEFVEATNSNSIEEGEENNSKNRRNEMIINEVKIPAENGAPVSFLIRPKRAGPIDIKLVATSQFASDGISQKLLVKPEGQTQYRNKAMLINLQPSPANEQQQLATITKNVSIEIPKNAVPDSQKVFVSLIGDIMGPGLSSVDDLLRLPYGCGEQNMINLVPNMVILNYLKNTKRIKEPQRVRATRNIELGYQRQLNYKRSDGSFSAFGEGDKNGSVWLSAYVLKTFQQIKSIITVDEKVIRRAANFIARNARSDGSIEEIGMLHDKQLASSSQSDNKKNPAYLTAYSMIALLQREIKPDDEAPAPIGLDEVLEKGLNNLEQRLDEAISNENPYDLAIITYALHLANRRPSMDKAYEQLWLKAKEEPEVGVWWDAKKKQHREKEEEEYKTRTDGGSDEMKSGKLKSLSPEEALEYQGLNATTVKPTIPPLIPFQVGSKQSEHLFVPDSLSVEMTSLALMSTVLRGDLDRALPIVKWLISQQNSNGGFASTQDTVLAIEALALFANQNAALKSPLSIDVDLIYPKERQNTNSTTTSLRRNNIDQFLISNTNALVNQQTRLPDSTSWVQIKATGTGTAVAQVSWQYNLFVSAEKPAFYLNPILDKTSNANYLQLSICTYYKGAGEQSNMAVMEVELPSGYVADVEALSGLMNIHDVKRVDTSNGNTKVIIYLDKVTRQNEICLTVPAHRTTQVMNNKPVPVSIYDYYNRQQVARIFYAPPKQTPQRIIATRGINNLAF